MTLIIGVVLGAIVVAATVVLFIMGRRYYLWWNRLPRMPDDELNHAKSISDLRYGWVPRFFLIFTILLGIGTYWATWVEDGERRAATVRESQRSYFDRQLDVYNDLLAAADALYRHTTFANGKIKPPPQKDFDAIDKLSVKVGVYGDFNVAVAALQFETAERPNKGNDKRTKSGLQLQLIALISELRRSVINSWGFTAKDYWAMEPAMFLGYTKGNRPYYQQIDYFATQEEARKLCVDKGGYLWDNFSKFHDFSEPRDSRAEAESTTGAFVCSDEARALSKMPPN